MSFEPDNRTERWDAVPPSGNEDGEAQIPPGGALAAGGPDTPAPDPVSGATGATGLGTDASVRRETFTVTGMDCGECALKIDRAVGRMPGVQRVATTFASSRMAVAFDPDSVSREAIERQVRSLGFGVHESHAQAQDHEESVPPARMLSMAVAGSFLLFGALLKHLHVAIIGDVFYVASILVGGWSVFRSAYGSLRAGFIGDINVLMSLAVVGAAALGKWDEAATVLFLFALGEWLEMYTMNRTRGSVRSLMALAPPVARLVEEHSEVQVPSGTVVVGSIIRVRPGERVPLDGEVAAGHSAVNQASVTGESIPVEKQVGDGVYAGTMNGDGVLDVRTTRVESDSTIARIADMVQEAQSRKAPSERLVDRFSRYYTPGVIALAALVGIVFPLAFHQPFQVWFYRALVLLVAACPCALVISTPVAVVSALGNAARRGILIKGGDALEAAGTVEIVALDKTGTLTEGLPVVTEVAPREGVDSDALASVAAGLEAHSTHPLGDALRRYAAERGLNVPEVQGFRNLPGRGVTGTVDGVPFFVGSIAAVTNGDGLPPALEAEADRLGAAGSTILAVASSTGTLGLIGVMDRPRPRAAEHLRSLRKAGIRRLAMLTGDDHRAAHAVAASVGVDDVFAELLPAQKRDAIERMEKEGRVAMVGDGVNDAPALAAATLGIAMGAVGSDAAIEAADIALMGDDLDHVREAILLSRRTVHIIRQNVAVAVIVKVAFLVAVLAGHATLWMAVAADTGASVLVTLNAMRLMLHDGWPVRRGPEPATPRQAVADSEAQAETTIERENW